MHSLSSEELFSSGEERTQNDATYMMAATQSGSLAGTFSSLSLLTKPTRPEFGMQGLDGATKLEELALQDWTSVRGET